MTATTVEAALALTIAVEQLGARDGLEHDALAVRWGSQR